MALLACWPTALAWDICFYSVPLHNSGAGSIRTQVGVQSDFALYMYT